MTGVVSPRLVVVTGAGSGIGRATALRFARTGAAVACLDIDEERAIDVAGECGSRATPFTCDVADPEAVADLAHRIESELGAVDVLVNNAGVGVGGDFLAVPLDDWAWIRSVNLDGVVHCAHAFGAPMVARGRGQVVNVASGLGYLPSRRTAAYCATKAGVVMLSHCLRADWARHGVGVSAVCPGVINTPIVHRARLHGLGTSEHRRFASAFRRGHSPDLVARAIQRAVIRDRALVPVGIEATVGYHAVRVLPAFGRELLGRVL